MCKKNVLMRRIRYRCYFVLGALSFSLTLLYIHFPNSAILPDECQDISWNCISRLYGGVKVRTFLGKVHDGVEHGVGEFEGGDVDAELAKIQPSRAEFLIRPLNYSNFDVAFLFSEAFKTLPRVADTAIYNINVSASVRAKPFRQIPDTRPESCHVTEWPGELPKVSIVIPFYMEHWSALIRTLASIYNRTDMDLVREIILVDDCNEIAVLQAPLRLYLAELPKLKLIRTKKREGLIRARMIGTRAARGDVLVILDGHVEVNADWLRPLLAEIANDRRTVAVPALDHIDPHTLTYDTWPAGYYGGFNWELEYVWTGIPDGLRARYDSGEAIPTPTLLGCALAVDRAYWFSQGGYDEELTIWGGESLELSFRTWMCGGRLLVVPCSRVGHIFRDTLPYIFDERTVYTNLQRVAEVWLDGYKTYYFQTTNRAYSFTASQRDSLRRRYQLRSQLHCAHNFSWYLQNVATMVKPPVPGSLMFGRFKSLSIKRCLTADPDWPFLTLDQCETRPEWQDFYYTEEHQIKYNATGCLTFPNPMRLSMALLGQCTTSDLGQKWLFDPILADRLRHLLVGLETRMAVGRFISFHGDLRKCLQVIVYKGRPVLIMQRCDAFSASQYWIISHEIHNSVKIVDNLHDSNQTIKHDG